MEKGLLFRGKAKAKRAQHGESARDTHYLVPADHGNCVAIVHGNSFRHAPNLIGAVGHRLSDINISEQLRFAISEKIQTHGIGAANQASLDSPDSQLAGMSLLTTVSDASEDVPESRHLDKG